jgi:hypothetical protein
MTSTELIRKFRHEIPEAHRTSLDTRLQWLWNQRFGTVQQIWKDSPDVEDKLAATVILQAIVGNDLNNIQLLFKRLEGGSLPDEVTLDGVLHI